MCVPAVSCLQVSQLMSVDRAKLVARSQLPVQLAPRPLGQPAAAAGGAGSAEQQDEDAGGGAGRAASERARDPETYDEGDFYSQLLKELLESGEADGQRPAATHARWCAATGGDFAIGWCSSACQQSTVIPSQSHVLES
jgi:hypothetical protein